MTNEQLAEIARLEKFWPNKDIRDLLAHAREQQAEIDKLRAVFTSLTPKEWDYLADMLDRGSDKQWAIGQQLRKVAQECHAIHPQSA